VHNCINCHAEQQGFTIKPSDNKASASAFFKLWPTVGVQTFPQTWSGLIFCLHSLFPTALKTQNPAREAGDHSLSLMCLTAMIRGLGNFLFDASLCYLHVVSWPICIWLPHTQQHSQHIPVFIYYPRESEGLCFYRRWFVCLFVCLLPR